MFQQNGKAPTLLSRAINNLQGKLKNSFLNGHPHHIVPGYNLSKNPDVENYDEDHLMNMFQEFPYDANLPKPLLPPARLPQCVLRNSDPALQLLKIKSEIKDNVNQIIKYHETHRKDLKVCHKTNLKWTKIGKDTVESSVPRYVAKLAEIMECDPDPEFEGEYNWYYTGGSLDNLCVFDRNILLFPYANELVAAPLIEKPNSSWKPNLRIAGKCDLRSTLYEVKHVVTAGRCCRILGRQKYSCNFYSLRDDQEKLELNEIHQELSELPYISADLNLIESNKYCVVNSSRSVEFKDLSKTKCLSCTTMPKHGTLPDNWMSIKFNKSDPNLITFVDRCCLYYIDLRIPLDGPTLTLCPKHNLEICEMISVNSASKQNSFHQYLGTYHSLLLCDSRFGNSSVVQKWTHQFKSPPVFSSIIERNGEEIITLSSQLAGENSIIINNWTNDTKMHSYALPYMPPSTSETLKACQDIGKCLEPNLRNRLELCNAGTVLNLNDRNDVTLFTQNSIGDIFYQCITHEKISGNDSDVNTNSLLALEAWEEACLAQSKTVKPLVISEKASMEHIFNEMRNKNRRLEQKEPKVRCHEPKWFQSVEELNSYVDIFAPELLAMWDIRQDSAPLTVTPHQKVLSWLEKKTPSQSTTQSQNLTQSQEDTSIINESNEILSQELISVSQNVPPQYTFDNTQNEQSCYDVPKSKKSRKKLATKKNYIAGF
ncbi:uncharacterized protein TAF1C-like [Neodiprion pinetum]|uniref:uncharacterized protein TAF1C-like n=1 Tax=Neodiprion pinetum TaxID=441929 RepID=UPI001EE04872|nr:uncharacterized protein LOC124222553 [Neodiprion pinetum]